MSRSFTGKPLRLHLVLPGGVGGEISVLREQVDAAFTLAEVELDDLDDRVTTLEGGGGGGPVAASSVTFDPDGDLVSEDVQEAIVELRNDTDTKLTFKASNTALNDAVDALETADTALSGAISGLDTRIDALEAAPAAGVPVVTYVRFPTGSDYYEAAVSVAPGADDFIVVALVRPTRTFQLSPGGGDYNIARMTNGTNIGWTMQGNFGTHRGFIYDASGGVVGSNFGASSFWGGSNADVVQRMQGRDAFVMMRVTRVASDLGNEALVNGVRCSNVGPANAGVAAAPGTGQQLRVGGSPAFDIGGIAYRAGTATNDEIETFFDECIEAGGLVPGGITWTNLWSTVGVTPGATWAATVGADVLTRAGSPTLLNRTLRIA